MKNWKALLQEGYFGAILAGQDVMPKFKQRFPNEFGTTQDEPVSYLRREDAIRLIDEPIRMGGPQGESRYRERAIDHVVELTAGSPFYIQIMCNRLVEYMNRKKARLLTDADVEQLTTELITGVNALGLDKFDNLISSGDTSPDAIGDKDVLAVLREIAVNSQVGSCSRSSIACETSVPIDAVLDDLEKRKVIEQERGQYYRIRVRLFRTGSRHIHEEVYMNKENPFSDFGTIVHQDRFVGRAIDLQVVESRVVRPPDAGNLAVIGEPRIGKSSLLYKSIMDRREQFRARRIVPIWMNLATYESPVQFFRSLVERCVDELEEVWSHARVSAAGSREGFAGDFFLG